MRDNLWRQLRDYKTTKLGKQVGKTGRKTQPQDMETDLEERGGWKLQGNERLCPFADQSTLYSQSLFHAE